MTHNNLQQLLSSTFGNSAKLTSKVIFRHEHTGKLHLHINHPSSNMQDDQNAFEGWALAFRVAGYEHIHLSWDLDNITNKKHYNRFLYRIVKFKQFFPWFSSESFDSEHIFGACVKRFINHGTEIASVKENPKSESAYEEKLYRSTEFREAHNIDDGMIARQLPVGVFRSNPPTEKEALFTGNSSAIDLYGLDRNGTLKLFELKVRGNKKVGALSEIFFYSCILEDVRNGFIKPSGEGVMRDSKLTWTDIINSKRIENYIISSGFLHPIVSEVCSSEVLSPFPVICIEDYQCK